MIPLSPSHLRIWIEITKQSKKYIIAGIYWHPNKSIREFSNKLDAVLHRIASQKVGLPCIVAGDFNIDLTKVTTDDNTSKYIDMLLMSNFLPAILIPTRIAGRSATLIDHIYYNLGSKYNVDAKHISGNFLQDIADHLPNYFVIYSNKPNTKKLPSLSNNLL